VFSEFDFTTLPVTVFWLAGGQHKGRRSRGARAGESEQQRGAEMAPLKARRDQEDPRPDFPPWAPLNPEVPYDHKCMKFTPQEISGAEDTKWYRGDPAQQRVRQTRAKYDNDSLMKSVLRGDYYNLRENGYSTIREDARLPWAYKDGSTFKPGLKTDVSMTRLQERSFFKLQQHDDYNRTLVSRVMRGDFMSADLSKKPRLNISNIITRNRRAASKPSSRSQSALDTRTGRECTRSDGKIEKRVAAERIASDYCDLIDVKAQRELVDFLARTSKESQASVEGLFESIRASSSKVRREQASKDAMLPVQDSREDSKDSRSCLAISTGYSTSQRPGTASVMERSARDLHHTIASQLHKDSPEDRRISTPKFGLSNLYKDRLMGHRAQCTGRFGHVPTSEERIRDLHKALRDHIYVKAKEKRDAWRWFNPDALGYIDVQGLFCIAQEFMIDCTEEECAALHRSLDLDGIVSLLGNPLVP
jgi:hypothetical protein